MAFTLENFWKFISCYDLFIYFSFLPEICCIAVLPAFSGNVPAALTTVYPSAEITRLGNWCILCDVLVVLLSQCLLLQYISKKAYYVYQYHKYYFLNKWTIVFYVSFSWKWKGQKIFMQCIFSQHVSWSLILNKNN